MTDLDAEVADLRERLDNFDDTSAADLTRLITDLRWTCTVAEQRLAVLEAAFGPRKEPAHVD